MVRNEPVGQLPRPTGAVENPAFLMDQGVNTSQSDLLFEPGRSASQNESVMGIPGTAACAVRDGALSDSSQTAANGAVERSIWLMDFNEEKEAQADRGIAGWFLVGPVEFSMINQHLLIQTSNVSVKRLQHSLLDLESGQIRRLLGGAEQPSAQTLAFVSTVIDKWHLISPTDAGSRSLLIPGTVETGSIR